MVTASELADALGRRTIADALGVLPTAVSNAVVRGWFPSSWFVAMKDLADAAGAECPPDLFNMRSIGPQPVDSAARFQPPAEKSPAADASLQGEDAA